MPSLMCATQHRPGDPGPEATIKVKLLEKMGNERPGTPWILEPTMDVPIPFILFPFVFILFICGLIFAAYYWRRHALKLQSLGRGVSTPVAHVTIDSTPGTHTEMARTGYHPTHQNTSGHDLRLVSHPKSLRYPLFTNMPSIVVKAPGIPGRWIPKQRSSQPRTIIPTYRSGSSSVLLVIVHHIIPN